MGSFLCPPGFAGPRGLRAIARETSAVSEAARFVRRSAHDRLHRRDASYAVRAADHGDPVVLVPGFLAGDGTLSLMARHLRGLGYRTYRSTIHANVGCTQEASGLSNDGSRRSPSSGAAGSPSSGTAWAA